MAGSQGSDGFVIALSVALVFCAAAALVFLVLALRGSRTTKMETQMGDLVRAHGEGMVRLQALADMLAGRQAELARAVNERLDTVSHHLNQSVHTTTQHTVDSLRQLHERIAVIDSAQKNLTDLSSQVTSLRDVLANKQTRGAFGQGRMEAIIQDGLPKGAYEFQFSLSNRSRPDCVIFLPDKRPLIVDAKFPLEAVTALREASTEEARGQAAKLFRQHIAKHVSDIADKYLIPGETQDVALMFVPSESLYAELHDGFDDVVQKAYRARVVIVSPSLLMLAIQVIQQIQKDARMREAADKIRDEVGQMMLDVARLHERVLKLQQHFGQASEDMRQIVISADKIERRGARIGQVEFGEDAPDQGGGPGMIAPPETAMLRRSDA
jgi:DNA recombination protein RmuC